MNSKSKRKKLMYEQQSDPYNPENHLKDEQIPDDTITVIIKCGGRTYMKGIRLPDTQEKTAALVGNAMQTVLDTVDAKGLKKGGSRFDPNNKEKKSEGIS